MTAVATTLQASPRLGLREVVKHFELRQRAGLLIRRRLVHAVDGVSFDIGAGETFALVGESGCGKSTTARIALGLSTADSGQVTFEGVGLDRLSRSEYRHRYRRKVQAVFQNPAASLNPRKRLSEILQRPLLVHGIADRPAARQRAVELLDQVGLQPADAFLSRYPHELSGGQQQRVAIARALALDPSVIVADEPVSALDVSIRAQILNLLRDIQAVSGVSILLITHDLAVVRSVAHRAAVMYLGQIVESGSVTDVFDNPRHPYTQTLLAASPSMQGDHDFAAQAITGEVPSATAPPSGCRFHPRCPIAVAECAQTAPPLLPKPTAGQVACHLAERQEETTSHLPTAH